MYVIFFYSNYFNIHLALPKSLNNEPEMVMMMGVMNINK